MVKVKLYTKSYCPYCHGALELFEQLGVEVENIEVDTQHKEEELEKVKKETGQTTVPQIFINEKFIGGFTELNKLLEEDKLKEILELE